MVPAPAMEHQADLLAGESSRLRLALLNIFAPLRKRLMTGWQSYEWQEAGCVWGGIAIGETL